MVTSYGTIQGYNGQVLVDSQDQVIIPGEAFGDAQDLHLIPPLLDGAKENTQAIGCGDDYFVGKNFTAGSNYRGPANLKKCEEEGLDAYIPDKRFRGRDPRFHDEHRPRYRRSDRWTLADFRYQKERDDYLCPKGGVFRLQVKGTVVDGTIYRRYSHGGKGLQRMRAQGQLRQGEEGETKRCDGSCGECNWQFEPSHGRQGR